jgi:3-keto-5-aminohexanoate cleavage enzyme
MTTAKRPDLIINFVPTGMVPTKEVTPHVPITATEIIEQVHEAHAIGITIAHIHARHADGTPAWEPEIYGPILDGIRRHCPDLVICVSLSGRSYGEFEKRSAVLQARPDMASLTLGSLNFSREVSVNSPEMIQRLAEAMVGYGVVPELECFDQGMIHFAKYLAGKGILKPPFYFNVLVGNIATAQADLTQVGVLLQNIPSGGLWSLGGIGHAQLRANTLAIVEGGGVRVGLEDNIWFDAERTQLATNTSLLRRIHELAAIFGRRPMTPAAFGALGFYNRHRPGAST